MTDILLILDYSSKVEVFRVPDNVWRTTLKPLADRLNQPSPQNLHKFAFLVGEAFHSNEITLLYETSDKALTQMAGGYARIVVIPAEERN